MSFFFNLDSVLPKAENVDLDSHMAPIYIDKEHNVDTFEVGSDVKILNLSAASGAFALAELIDKAPLYRMNMELTLDSALSRRSNNATLSAALEKAFAPKKLPLVSEKMALDHGQLAHPMLSHMKSKDLAAFYINLLDNLNDDKILYQSYGFDKILHDSPKRFWQDFDGYAHLGFGFVRLSNLLFHARRMEVKCCVNAKDPLERYLEYTLCQYRRALSVDKIMSLGFGTKIPHWIRADMRQILRCEEGKQKAAGDFLNQEHSNKNKLHSKAMEAALKQDGKGGHVAPALANMVSETLNVTSTKFYYGSGKVFANNLKAVISSD